MALNLFPQPSSLVEIEGSGKLSFTEDSASATRIAVCDGAHLIPSIQFLMGYVYQDANGKDVRVGADVFLPFTRLRCSSVDVEPHGEMGNGSWDTGPFYAKAKLTIKYSVPPWEEDDASDGPEDITFLTQSLDYSCEILTVPVKIGSTGIPAAQRKTANRNIRLPLVTYTMELPRVKKPKWTTIQDMVGKVNSATLFGGAPETVLFDGPNVNRSVTLLGDKSWKFVGKFIYNRHGWNNSLNPDTLVWEPVRNATTGATPPYETANLKELLT
jgi:hypothetical protein